MCLISFHHARSFAGKRWEREKWGYGRTVQLQQLLELQCMCLHLWSFVFPCNAAKLFSVPHPFFCCCTGFIKVACWRPLKFWDVETGRRARQLAVLPPARGQLYALAPSSSLITIFMATTFGDCVLMMFLSFWLPLSAGCLFCRLMQFRTCFIIVVMLVEVLPTPVAG